MQARKPNLLVIEDEPAIRSGLVDVFTYHGFSVDSAATGTDGLERALRGKYDLILLDVMLPGLDGFEICNRIRAVDRTQPIILVTAKSNDDDIIQGLTLGADDYVTKPFSVTALVLRVNAVLRRAGFAQEQVAIITLGNEIVIDTRNLTGTRANKKNKLYTT